jgi:hypothetical protein
MNKVLNENCVSSFTLLRLSLDIESESCGLYYKPMTIINDDSRVINKHEASLSDNARVVIYDCHMFIVQATDSKKSYDNLEIFLKVALIT